MQALLCLAQQDLFYQAQKALFYYLGTTGSVLPVMPVTLSAADRFVPGPARPVVPVMSSQSLWSADKSRCYLCILFHNLACRSPGQRQYVI